MTADYPKFIPIPNFVPPTPKRDKDGNLIPLAKTPANEGLMKVFTPEEHQAKHPHHFAQLQDEQEAALNPPVSQASAELAAEVREHCAVIAESFPKSGKLGLAIAEAIRTGSHSEPKDDDSSKQFTPQSQTADV